MFELTKISIKNLLELQANTLKELKNRGVLKTFNKPTGDLAEHIFCNAFNWEMAKNSQLGFDATDKNGLRYQIKARQISTGKKSDRQLSALRNIEQKHFDYIAAILFNRDYSIFRAAIIPYDVILNSNPYYAAHDNKYIFYLTDNIWDIDGVKDVTKKIIKTFDSL